MSRKPIVRRYRPGKVPEYVNDEDAQKFLDDKKKVAKSDGGISFGTFGMKVTPKEDDRLARLRVGSLDSGESRQERHRRIIEAAEILEDVKEEDTRRRRRPVAEPEILEEISNEEEAKQTETILPDGETPTQRRERLKKDQANTTEEPKEEMGELPIADEESEGSSEESSSDNSDSSEDDEWDLGGRRLIRPTFVKKDERDIEAEKEAEFEKEKERLKKKEQEALERKQRTISLLQDQLARDKEALDQKEVEIVFDSEGEEVEMQDEDDPIYKETEYEKWKLRELMRVRRDREERETHKKVKEDAARRRVMTDEDVMAEKRNTGEGKKEKTNMKFMQKYYHKGAFYQEELKSLEKKPDEWTAPTGWDREVDVAALPKVLQVKNFGLAGRTKYTHLVDQDTSKPDDPWAKAHSAGFKSRGPSTSNPLPPHYTGADGSVQAGAAIISKNKKRLGGFGDFSRPSKKRKKQ